MDQVLARREEAPRLHRDVPRHLHHPGLMGIRCHCSDMHFPGAEPDKEQDIIRHKPTQRPDLSGEEVGGDQYIHMRTNKLLPRGGRLAFWRRRNTMALEDIAHRLITDRTPAP